MRAFRVDLKKTSGKSLEVAATVLRAGGIVAFPTETVYGLCVDAGNPKAVEKLYDLKGREGAKACAHLVGSRRDAEELVSGLPAPAARLADAFWPGPLTLVVPDPEGVTVGLRYSSVPLARALARTFGGPLLQTSANRSGHPAALNASGVLLALPRGVDLVLDAGRVPGGEASTVVLCDEYRFEVLREGAIPTEDVERVARERILVVCTGNICRSPIAEEMLRVMLDERAPGAFEISSCGTHGWDDAPAAPEAEKAARAAGYDITAHRGRASDPEMLGSAHRVYVMARHHLDALRDYFQDRPDALQLFDPGGDDVEDPYQKSKRVFRQVTERIEELARLRATELVPDVA
ncbi:MAG: L-threonylcarbamoyladenylate synthase [Planctomycetota bacterium]